MSSLTAVHRCPATFRHAHAWRTAGHSLTGSRSRRRGGPMSPNRPRRRWRRHRSRRRRSRTAMAAGDRRSGRGVVSHPKHGCLDVCVHQYRLIRTNIRIDMSTTAFMYGWGATAARRRHGQGPEAADRAAPGPLAEVRMRDGGQARPGGFRPRPRPGRGSFARGAAQATRGWGERTSRARRAQGLGAVELEDLREGGDRGLGHDRPQVPADHRHGPRPRRKIG